MFIIILFYLIINTIPMATKTVRVTTFFKISSFCVPQNQKNHEGLEQHEGE